MPSCRRSSANAFEVREGVGLQRALPLRHMLGVLQLACQDRQRLVGSFLEGDVVCVGDPIRFATLGSVQKARFNTLQQAAGR